MAYSSCLNRSLKPNGEIQCRSNFRFTRGIRAVRGGPPRLLSSRESIHPLSVYGYKIYGGSGALVFSVYFPRFRCYCGLYATDRDM
uniref:Uncharacterized protein ycf68 n=1 Tax=Gaultheria ciliisepala TaxID=1965077 RepID=A0A1X9PF00_9ERIC|nr:hypothetical chloroplast RF68 [Gaultheria ciliisepala]